jgi:hypothetical protein
LISERRTRKDVVWNVVWIVCAVHSIDLKRNWKPALWNYIYFSYSDLNNVTFFFHQNCSPRRRQLRSPHVTSEVGRRALKFKRDSSGATSIFILEKTFHGCSVFTFYVSENYVRSWRCACPVIDIQIFPGEVRQKSLQHELMARWQRSGNM